MNTNINVVQGDYGYQILFTLQNSDGSAFNLTDNEGLVLRVQQLNKTAIKFLGTMGVTSATAGTCYYQVAQGNFNQAGTYNAQIQVSFVSEVITFPNITITATAQLPA